MTNFSHFLGSSTKISMLISKYYKKSADRMEDYLNGIDEDPMRSIRSGEFNLVMLLDNGTIASNEDMITHGKKMKANNKKMST